MTLLRKLLIILFLGLVVAISPPPVQAESAAPENCAPRPFDKGRLWLVRQGDGPVSYIFGTMHSKDPRILQLPGIIMQAFIGSSRLLVETSLRDEDIAGNQQLMLGGEGYSLAQQIGQQRFAALAELVSRYGIPATTLDRFKIWAAASILSQPAPDRQAGGDSLAFLDRELEKSAWQMQKQVIPLESMEEQLSLFDRLPQSAQIEFLVQAMEEFPELDQEVAKLTEHYLSGQLGWIFCDMEEDLQDVSPVLVTLIRDELIIMRNRRMVERMLAPLKKGRAFVAIGALHLPGKEGVLNLLQENGFQLQRRF